MTCGDANRSGLGTGVDKRFGPHFARHPHTARRRHYLEQAHPAVLAWSWIKVHFWVHRNSYLVSPPSRSLLLSHTLCLSLSLSLARSLALSLCLCLSLSLSHTHTLSLPPSLSFTGPDRAFTGGRTLAILRGRSVLVGTALRGTGNMRHFLVFWRGFNAVVKVGFLFLHIK